MVTYLSCENSPNTLSNLLTKLLKFFSEQSTVDKIVLLVDIIAEIYGKLVINEGWLYSDTKLMMLKFVDAQLDTLEKSCDLSYKCVIIKALMLLLVQDSTLLSKGNKDKMLMDSFFSILQSKLTPKDRKMILQSCPYFTGSMSYYQKKEIVLCYQLSAIEMKLLLEEIFHRMDNHEAIEISLSDKQTLVACCETIEYGLNEIVSDAQSIPVETSAALIDAIRMCMKSVMFFMEHSSYDYDFFPAVFRMYMRWLSEDNYDVSDVIQSFVHCRNLLATNWKSYSHFLPSAVINQMESRLFVDFLENEYGLYLVELSLINNPIEEGIVLAPIFNELLSRKVYLDLSGLLSKTSAKDSITACSGIKSSKFSFEMLTLIQFIAYVNMCAFVFQKTIDGLDFDNWLVKSINYVLKPIFDEALPKKWMDLQNVWISSVNSICICLHTVQSNTARMQINIDGLVSKCNNNSESVDEITDTLEELLSAIIQ